MVPLFALRLLCLKIFEAFVEDSLDMVFHAKLERVC